MSDKLNRTSETQGFQADIVILDEVDSTMTEAAQRADALSRPAWIFARRQTAGRGRRGRVWSDSAGNFAATLVLFPHDQLPRVALRSFVAALAVYDALARYIDPVDMHLKWPNDVLVRDRKIAGILLESANNGSLCTRLSIGIGVNLAHCPPVDPDAAFAPIALFEAMGYSVDPQTYLKELTTAYARYETLFQAEGFAPIRALWLERAARLGQSITARITADHTVSGVFEGIDTAGQLELSTASGIVKIPAADIFFQDTSYAVNH